MPIPCTPRHVSHHRNALLTHGVILAVALTGSAALVQTAPASAASRCSPPGEPMSSATARADRSNGSEVTEYLPDGGYRVTRCNRDGSLRVSQTVSPIADPDGGTVLVPTERAAPGVRVAALYGDPSERKWAAEFRRTRAQRAAAVLPPTSGVVPSDSAAAPADDVGAKTDSTLGTTAAAGAECTAGQYAFWPGAWTGRWYSYAANRSRFNYNDNIIASIVAGHRAWDTTYNSCGYADITNLTSSYAGSSTATAHTSPDGTSVVDRGDLVGVGCAGALACTWLFPNGSGVATETDQRYNEALSFSTVGAAGAYDYQAVATHESGHSIGLDHANSSSALTMYYAIAAGATQARTLARGDVLGLRTRYP